MKLDKLPVELLLFILSNLTNIKDIIHLSMLNKQMKEIINDTDWMHPSRLNPDSLMITSKFNTFKTILATEVTILQHEKRKLQREELIHRVFGRPVDKQELCEEASACVGGCCCCAMTIYGCTQVVNPVSLFISFLCGIGLYCEVSSDHYRKYRLWREDHKSSCTDLKKIKYNKERNEEFLSFYKQYPLRLKCSKSSERKLIKELKEEMQNLNAEIQLRHRH